MAKDKGANDAEGFNSLKEGSTDSTAIAAYYDDWAETYNATLKDWNYQAPADAAAALAVHLQPGDWVLDVGCGTGMFGRALSAVLDCRIEGVDISEASLKVATTDGVYDKLRAVNLQATPLPLKTDTYAGAACIGVMTYIEDARALLTDLCRVVRPGGHILFTHRDDRWAELDFDGLVADLAAQGLWKTLAISAPKPYLPENEDFGDEIRVIYAQFCVV